MKQPVIIIGAGIAGLAAGYTLSQRKIPLRILEHKHYAGGRLLNVEERFNTGHIIPSSSQKTLEMAKTLGLTSKLYPGPNLKINFKGNMYPVLGLIPYTSLLSFKSNINSWRMRKRALKSFKGRLSLSLDVSTKLDMTKASSYISNYAGSEALEKFFRPVLQVLTYCPPEDISMAYVMRVLENWDGRKPVGGIHGLPVRLAAALPIEWNSEVSQILIKEGMVKGVVVKRGDKEEEIKADNVICAVPPHVASHLLREVSIKSLSLLSQYKYASLTVVSFETSAPLTWERIALTNIDPKTPFLITRLKSVQERNGFVQGWFFGSIPSSESNTIILRCQEEINRIWPELREKLDQGRVHTFVHAVPVFSEGTHTSIKRMMKDIQSLKGIYLAGDYIKGGWTEASVDSGVQAALNILSEQQT